MSQWYRAGKQHGGRNNRSRGRSRPDTYRFKSYLTKDDLNELLDQSVAELVQDVSSEIKRFQVTLEESDICSKHLGLVLKLLLKVSSGLSSVSGDVHSNSIMILGEVFNDRCSTFQSQLKKYVAQKMQHYDHDSLTIVCDFFEILLIKLPATCWSILPLDELSQTIASLRTIGHLANDNAILSKLKSMLELRSAFKEQTQVRHISSSRSDVAGLKRWDNTEYRNTPILPQWKEISTPKPPYRLRPNIVDGEYEDWMHYYDVQFRLLREDFISPLRKGIKDYHDGKVGRNLSNLRLYNGVTIVRPLFTNAGMCHKIRFDVEHMRCNWEHSKRLIFGSLLCLSPDKFFRTVYFATVSNRDPNDLGHGILEVMFQEGAGLITDQKLCTQFVMVESVAFFEASRHILRSLQTAEESTMPFTKYLIKNDSKDINPPKYLDLCPPGTTYNMSLIVKDEILSRPRLALKFSRVNIRETLQWPPLEDTRLDESQLMAMKMALTQEIAVIQGPPGTGKTYIGLKIVQALLNNFSAWSSTHLKAEDSQLQSPILVMCFTNHALDQFLEGIMELNEDKELNLIRVGGRSKNEKIQKCNLNTVKRNLRNVPKEEYNEMKRRNEVRDHVGALCQGKLRKYEDPVHQFICFSDIRYVISEHHRRSLYDPAESLEEQREALELWLGLYEKKVLEEMTPVEFTGEDFESCSDDDGSDSDGSSSEYDTANSEFESEEETVDDQETSDTIEILGEGSREEEARYIEGMEEWFQERTFDAVSVVKEKKWKRTHKIRRIVKIEKCQNYKGFMESKMRDVTSTAINEFDAEEIENVNALSLDERWELYKYWHSKHRAHLLKDIEEECQKYNEVCEEASAAQRNNDRYALETAHVIGMTTTGAAKYQHVLHLVKPRIVIVEEAAEVLESHIVSALNAGTHHLILIGDHKQLRPKPNEYDLAVKYKLDVSLFERLVKNDFPHATLQNQHRMRPEIAELVKPHIYDTLHNHDSVQNYPKVKGIICDLFLISHSEPERPSSDLSHSNQHEAQYLIALCKYLLQQGYEPSQITVLVTYTGQLLLMKNSMPRSEFEGVRISTVDNFQGEENDIILLSLVRSNKESSIGFLREENRVCVSLSRAKHGFYCIGNFEMLRKNSRVWQEIVSDMESKGRVGEGLQIHCINHPDNKYMAKSPDDFAKNSPRGGCKLDCGIRLKCGHTCPQKCHLSDPKHLEYKCKKQCGRECPRGHICNSQCYMKCLCMVTLNKEMPNCEHTKKMHCHQDPKQMSCEYVVEKIIPQCEHSLKMFCYQDPKKILCPKIVEKIIPQCEHSQEMLCHRDPNRFPCKFVVEKKMPRCDHTQEMYCHQNPTGFKCQTVVAKGLQCGHTQDVLCYTSHFRMPCKNQCEKPCPKGHPCQQKCHYSTPCHPCKTKVMVTIPVCSHKQQALCHQDPAKMKCLAKCERTCSKRGHPCPLKCHQECQDCKVMVEISLECGHSASVQCLEADKYRCTRMVDKTLSCGHATFICCSKDTSSIVCRSMVDITLKKCRHTHSVQCSTDIKSIECTTIINVPLECGHSTSALCSADVNSIKCTEPCRKVLKCGHGKMLSCHIDPNSVTCTKPCIKPLSCGHTTKVACFEEVSSAKCVEQCSKDLPCGHSVTTECNSDPSTIICQKPCTKTLKCGHKCHEVCGKKCACSERVKVTLPLCGHSENMFCTQSSDLMKITCTHACDKKQPCGHKCRNKCGDLCTETCKELVTFKCRQGHERTMLCCHRSTVPCKRKCEEMLKCGHPCQKKCSDPCTTECKFLVVKKYPCDHEHRIPCCKPMEEMPCDLICRKVLACGHYCRGMCSDCLSARIHKPCTSTVGMKHFCGEKTRMRCLGLKNKHSSSSKGKGLKVIECKHRKIPWNCSTPLVQCDEACGWSCPPQCPRRKKCSMSCSKPCDREPCDERCSKSLACGHQCIGLCGEPCITLCPNCDPVQFSSQHKQASEYSIKECYIQLPCGHVFTVKTMDKHVARTSDSDSEVCPLQCPICSSPLSCSFRYGNPMKTSLRDFEAVRERVRYKWKEKKMILLKMYSDVYKRISKSQLDEKDTPTLVRCLSVAMRKLSDTHYRPEEEFLFFLLVKMFHFVAQSALSEKVRAIIEELCSWIHTNLSSVKLSYQVINDLLSEYYRLCLEVRTLGLEQYYSADIKEQILFLNTLDRNHRLQVSRRDFVSHSRSLDQKFRSRHSNYINTEEVIDEIERFQPVIQNGLWRKCGFGHFYCVPVSEPQCLKVQCSECIGTYSGSIEICVPREVQPVYIDIAQQRQKAIATEMARVEISRAQGGVSEKTKKRRKKPNLGGVSEKKTKRRKKPRRKR